MGEVLKSFFNFTGISLRFLMWFTGLVIVPATAWFWDLNQDLGFLKNASAAQEKKINSIEFARQQEFKIRAEENLELTRELKEVQRSLGRIEGALGTK